MTTKTGAPFEISKNGEVFGSDDGLDLWNTVSESDLVAPDEVTVNVDPMSGEVNLMEEMDPSSGAAPPSIGSYPSRQSTQSAQGPVQVPDYLSPDPVVQDEDMTKYRQFLAKVLTSDREREIEQNSFLKLKALYSLLQKGWNTDAQIKAICDQTKALMQIYGEQYRAEENDESFDRDFLEKASQILLAFDPTLPNTRFLAKRHWISKIYEIPQNRVTTLQKAAGGHYYISGIVSDTSVDRDGDRMSYNALKQMEQALNEGILLFANHHHDVEDTLGTPVKAELRGNQNDAELWAEFKLEDPEYNPNVKNIIHKLETGERLGFSIGGESPSRFNFERSSDGKSVRVIPGINIYEVSVVAIPSNSHSYVMGTVFKGLRPNPNYN